jgi:hypothetical protein
VDDINKITYNGVNYDFDSIYNRPLDHVWGPWNGATEADLMCSCECHSLGHDGSCVNCYPEGLWLDKRVAAATVHDRYIAKAKSGRW